jgi:hypothetical protein
MHGETGDQTDQESRSAGDRAAAKVTAVSITIHMTFLPDDDSDASEVERLGLLRRTEILRDG